MNDGSWALWGILVLAAALVSFYTGVELAKGHQQKKAIAAGVAQWTINPETGETLFVYGKENP